MIQSISLGYDDSVTMFYIPSKTSHDVLNVRKMQPWDKLYNLYLIKQI